jgi:hypothetical protein
MSVSPYRLSISIKLPKIATEGEAFALTYEVKNTGGSNFPGGALNVIMSWPAIGSTMFVGHPLTVEPLGPDEVWISHEFREIPIVTGYTVFTPANIPFRANDGRAIELYLADGATLSLNRPIGAIRARSHEEISQKQAVQIAVVSLVVVAIFEVANLIVALLK